MATTPEFSQLLARLLQPIAGDAPCGPELRDSIQLDSFTKLQTVIKEDRRYQDKAGHEGKPANWNEVQERAISILADESKDVEVAVWLVRALVKTAGLDGLRNGLELLRALYGKFGDGLHPRDVDACRSRLEWMDQQLEMDLRAIEVPEAAQQEQLAALSHSAKEAIGDVVKSVAELKGRYGQDPPTFRGIRQALDFLAGAAAERLGESPAGPAIGSEAAATGGTAAPRSGPRSREEALHMLGLVVAYFEAAEPLSPVPHLLRRAARWARGSLQQWIDEMVGKEDQLEVIYKTLDMTKPAPKE